MLKHWWPKKLSFSQLLKLPPSFFPLVFSQMFPYSAPLQDLVSKRVDNRVALRLGGGKVGVLRGGEVDRGAGQIRVPLKKTVISW